jgi:hypothetical protein
LVKGVFVQAQKIDEISKIICDDKMLDAHWGESWNEAFALLPAKLNLTEFPW